MKKRLVKWTLGVLLTPILLIILAVVAVYIPAVQDYAVQQSTAYLSKTTGMQVHVDKFRLTFLLDVSLRGVTIADEEQHQLLSVSNLTIDLDLHHIFNGEVRVEGVTLDEARVDSRQLITGLTLQGMIHHLFLEARQVNLKQSHVLLNRLDVDGVQLNLALADTTETDTATSQPLAWVIDVDDVKLNKVQLQLVMPGDSMRVKTGIHNTELQQAKIDLAQGLYTVNHFMLQADSVRYDLPYEKVAVSGLDVSHLAFKDVRLAVDSLSFEQEAVRLALQLREGRLKEKCGLSIDTLQAVLRMDSTSIHLNELLLKTPCSHVQGKVDMDFNAVVEHPQGNILAALNAEIGKPDVMLCVGELPKEVIKAYPLAPVSVRLKVDGNMDLMQVNQAEAWLPNTFRLKADGYVQNLLDMEHLIANMDVRVNTYNLNFVRALAGAEAMKGIALPPMQLDGKVKMDGQQYAANLVLKEGAGKVNIDARYHAKQEVYKAKLQVDKLNLHHFLPQDSLYHLTLLAEAEGRGLDVMQKRTKLNVQAVVKQLQYGQLNLDGVKLGARLQNGFGHVRFDSDNPLLEMVTTIDAMLAQKQTDLTFCLDLRKIDLHALRITEKPFSAGMCLHMDGHTNLKDSHEAKGGINDITLRVADSVFYPKDINLNMLASPDTTYADISAGDLKLLLNGYDGYEKLLASAQAFAELGQAQLKRRHLDQDSLKALLPKLSLCFKAGKDNPVCNYLATMGYSFRDVDFDINADPLVGLNGGGYIHSLNVAGVQIDTIQMNIFQDSTGVKMDGRVRNGPKNKQFVFDSRIDAYLHAQGAGVALTYHDEQGKTGVDVGLRADLMEKGINLVLSNPHPIIAYRRFKINDDNYIFLGNDRRVEADVDMLADDGTRARIYSTPNADALQDISIAISNLNLGELTSVIPYAPRMGGLMGVDAHLIQTEENLSVMMDGLVDEMTYEGAPLGDVGLNAVYLPNEDGTHFVDARVSSAENEVLALQGSYKAEKESDLLDAKVELLDFPLNMANGMVEGGLVQLGGWANGELKVHGPTANPGLAGWLATKDMTVLSPEYSLKLRLADDSVKLVNSQLNLDKLEVYSTGKNPLVFDGKIDLRHLDNPKLNLQVAAQNFELINARRTQTASAYGKVYVDLNGRLRGDMSDINMTGRLNVLGNTDVTYVLKDTPLSSEDRLSGLVEFIDFDDTTAVVEKEVVKPMNLTMNMAISIEQAAQVHCMLSPDRSKYVDLEGGGDLMMNYTPQGNLTLTGRYTMLSGEMKYSLPVIPLKTFTLASGSYVDFKGPILNPSLNISATERVRATVTENDVPRTVAFDVGLTISQTLENMGLEFTLEAPEDMTIQNQLTAMSLEQRGRLAVTMLATGMYLADNNLGSLTTTNALNALLQSEISNIAGRALETIDLSVGMDQATTATGGDRTDYSFRFAKRLWGNRVSIIIGGKVSSGDDVENNGQSIIDNVSLEYRLDKSATRYVSLFYDKNYESLLEGEITEMGAGIVLRRKMTRLGELFIFKNKKKTPAPVAVKKEDEE